MNNNKLAIAVLMIAGAVPGLGHSATATGTLTATATVNSVCNVTGITNIAFGGYDPTSVTPTDANGDVSVSCTKNTPYQVYISAVRTMSDGTDTLNFQLYNDAVGGTVWGSATGAPGNITNTPASNAATAHTIYGRIPALQNVGSGAYTGNVTVTIEY